MRKFTRSEAPAILTALVPPTQQPRWEVFGDRYNQNRQANPGHAFQWPQVDNLPLNQHLLPVLRDLTDGHCAYCDLYPLRKPEESIDHFLPKSNPQFYTLVCQWENLYLSCPTCQSKGDQYNADLLRPDEVTFTFSRYFIYNYQSHEIEVNPLATPNDQRRADVTTRLFRLNDTGHCSARRIALERWMKRDPDYVLADYNYRYMLDF